MFASNGEITPPWGVPPSGSLIVPSSKTPAVNHLSIVFRITPSRTRLSRNPLKCLCSSVSKEVTTHYPPRRFPVQSNHRPRQPPFTESESGAFRLDAPRRCFTPDFGPAGWQPITYSRCLDQSGSEQPSSRCFQTQPTSVSPRGYGFSPPARS
jgi:hypothetical protein